MDAKRDKSDSSQIYWTHTYNIFLFYFPNQSFGQKNCQKSVTNAPQLELLELACLIKKIPKLDIYVTMTYDKQKLQILPTDKLEPGTDRHPFRLIVA